MTRTQPKSYETVIGTVMALIENVKNNKSYDNPTNMGGVDLDYGGIDEVFENEE